MGQFFSGKSVLPVVMGLGNLTVGIYRYPDLQVPDASSAGVVTGSFRLRGYLEDAIRKGGNFTG